MYALTPYLLLCSHNLCVLLLFIFFFSFCAAQGCCCSGLVLFRVGSLLILLFWEEKRSELERTVLHTIQLMSLTVACHCCFALRLNIYHSSCIIELVGNLNRFPFFEVEAHMNFLAFCCEKRFKVWVGSNNSCEHK